MRQEAFVARIPGCLPFINACAYIHTWATEKCCGCRETRFIYHLAEAIFLTYFNFDLKSRTPSCLVLVASRRSMLCSRDRLSIHFTVFPGTQSRRRRRLRVTIHPNVQDAPQSRLVVVTRFRSSGLPNFKIFAGVGH